MAAFPAGRRQRGAVMIVTLLFLVILTMLGITAMTGTTMEERMAGNARDYSVAFQAAEAVMRDARRDLSGKDHFGAGLSRGRPPATGDFGDVPANADFANPGTCATSADRIGFCAPATNPDGSEYGKLPGAVMPSTPKHNMNGSPSVAYGKKSGATPLGGPSAAQQLARQPRYIIENFCLMQHGETLQPICKFYRTTAVGYGRNPNTAVTLQEMFVSLD